MYDAYNQATNPLFERYVAESVPYGQQLLGDISKQQQDVTRLF